MANDTRLLRWQGDGVMGHLDLECPSCGKTVRPKFLQGETGASLVFACDGFRKYAEFDVTGDVETYKRWAAEHFEDAARRNGSEER